jgi:hypothetical protein
MRNRIVAALLLCAAFPALAKDVDIDCVGCQAAFDVVAEDLVATIDYKANGPAEATGIVGIGLGVFGTYTAVDDEWETVTGSDFSGIGLAGIQASKGLPLNIDVGAYYASAPGTDLKVYGVQARYAILPGSTVSPAVALGVAYSKLSGADDFELDSQSVDLSVSKGFGPFTPFAGVGYVNGTADPDASTGLDEAEVKETKLYAGARLSLGFLEVTPQVTKIGDATSFSARFGFSFSL